MDGARKTIDVMDRKFEQFIAVQIKQNEGNQIRQKSSSTLYREPGPTKSSKILHFTADSAESAKSYETSTHR